MNPFRLAAFALLLQGAATAAHAQWLVTLEEAAAALAAPEPIIAKQAPEVGAPRIRLLAPDVSGPVSSPTRITLRFEATAPAAIRPESFKARYGALRLDITSRITAVSKVGAEGIDVAEAELPKGSHRIYLEIQDTMGRTGESLLQFVIP